MRKNQQNVDEQRQNPSKMRKKDNPSAQREKEAQIKIYHK